MRVTWYFPVVAMIHLLTRLWVTFFLLVLLASCGSDNSSPAPEGMPPADEEADEPVEEEVPATELKAGVYHTAVVEGAGELEFIVSLSEAGEDIVSIDYQTQDGSAVAGTDYQARSGSLQFAPGERRKSVSVTVLVNAGSPQSSKSMQLAISSTDGLEMNQSVASGTIIDRDYMTSVAAYDPDWSTLGVFQGAVACESCHLSDGSIMQYDNTSVTLNTDDVSASSQWPHTVMAHAANDPYWQAAVEDEAATFPEASGVIEDTCNTCHTPMGRTHAHHSDTDLDVDGNYRFATAMGQGHAREGVSCPACHLIEAGNMGSEGSYSGGYSITSAPTDDKPMYGVYSNPIRGAMRNTTIYDPRQGAHVGSSELCATCHTLYTPVLEDPESEGFLEQAPYLEWLNSAYVTGKFEEKQCQDCHMPEPETGYMTPITTMPNAAGERGPYAQHTFVGGNTHLLEMLKAYRVEQGISATTTEAGFDDQISLSRQFIETSSAELSIESATVDGSTLSFDVDVTNLTGHKLPTAYPSRRTWLHVTVRDNTDAVVFESGKPDARGYISTDVARLKADCMAAEKLEGFDSALCYEPHRDSINSADQVAIYEPVLGDVHGDITHTLLKSSQYLKDNRIPPKGFTDAVAATIEAQTIPVGVSGDDDFNCVATAEGCGADTVHYLVDVEGASGPYKVDARLLYQATQPAFVDGLHAHAERVNRFRVMYDAIPPAVEVLAEDNATGIN